MDFRLPTNRKLAETPAFSGIDPKHVYDLAELIDVAQSNNQNTRIAWNSAREAALAAGVARSAVQRAQAQVDSAGSQLERTRNEAMRHIVAANNALKTSLASHSAARELESASATAFDAVLTAYRAGVETSTALALAQTRLVQARMAVADAYSASLSAAAALALATGTLGSTPL